MGDPVITPYDLINVQIGNEQMGARPVRWDVESIDGEGHSNLAGDFMQPTAYQGTCPKCSQMTEFEAGMVEVQCEQCGYGNNRKLYEPLEDPFMDPVEISLPDPKPQPIDQETRLSELLGEEV